VPGPVPRQPAPGGRAYRNFKRPLERPVAPEKPDEELGWRRRMPGWVGGDGCWAQAGRDGLDLARVPPPCAHSARLDASPGVRPALMSSLDPRVDPGSVTSRQLGAQHRPGCVAALQSVEASLMSTGAAQAASVCPASRARPLGGGCGSPGPGASGSLDDRPLEDGRNDLQFPAAAGRAVLHVDVKDPLEQPPQLMRSRWASANAGYVCSTLNNSRWGRCWHGCSMTAMCRRP